MSQQLMRLRADGLVEARREGTSVFYRIAREEVLMVIEALHAGLLGRHPRAAEGSRHSAARPRTPPAPRGTSRVGVPFLAPPEALTLSARAARLRWSAAAFPGTARTRAAARGRA